MRFSILSLALAALTTLAFGKDHIKHHLKSALQELADPTPWPYVKTPLNFWYYLSFYNYNKETHKMIFDQDHY